MVGLNLNSCFMFQKTSYGQKCWIVELIIKSRFPRCLERQISDIIIYLCIEVYTFINNYVYLFPFCLAFVSSSLKQHFLDLFPVFLVALLFSFLPEKLEITSFTSLIHKITDLMKLFPLLSKDFKPNPHFPGIENRQQKTLRPELLIDIVTIWSLKPNMLSVVGWKTQMDCRGLVIGELNRKYCKKDFCCDFSREEVRLSSHWKCAVGDALHTKLSSIP